MSLLTNQNALPVAYTMYRSPYYKNEINYKIKRKSFGKVRELDSSNNGETTLS